MKREKQGRSKSRRWTRAALALGVAVLLAACGGGGGGTEDEPPVPAFLNGVPAYGDANTPPPEGAALMTAEEAERLAASGTLTWITAAERERLAADETTRQTDIRRRLEALPSADRDAIALWSQATLDTGAQALDDGSWLVPLNATDPQSRRVVTQAQRHVLDDLASGLREGKTRASREALFNMLIDALADDQRDGLPAPAQLGTLSDDALDAAVATLTQRVTETVDPDGLPTTVATGGEPLAQSAAGPVALNSGCTQFGPAGLYATQNWPLKHALSPIRDQGYRGSCVSFAINAALETLVRRSYGRSVDLSEQQVYGAARGPWSAGPAPTWYDFRTDGLPGWWTVDQMKLREFAVVPESGWRYNPALQRSLYGTTWAPYPQSCDGYTGTCSDTNHQQDFRCIKVGTKHWCAFHNQLDRSTPDSERYILQQYVPLWQEKDNLSVPQEAEEALQRVRAALLWGKPVKLSMVVDRPFLNAAPAVLINDPLQPTRRIVNPLSRLTSNEITYSYGGGHAVMITGYVSFASIDAAAEAAGVPRNERLTWGLDAATEGGGFFIIRNSWGCGWGDGGYTYATAGYLKHRAYGLLALTQVSGQAPSATLSASTSSITTAAQTLRLRAAGNALVRSVEFYRVAGALAAKIGEDTAAPYENNVAFDAGSSGAQRYFAVAIDSAGNRASTNVVAVNVAVPADLAPAIDSFTASPASTPPGGGAVTLSWTVSNAQSLNIAGIGDVSGQSSAVVNLSVTTSYVLTASNAVGSSTATATVTVPLPLIQSFSAAPASLPVGGGAVTLSWNVQGAASVSLSGGIGSVAASGSRVVNTTASTSWTLTATAPSGTRTASAAVTVAADTVAPTVTLTASPAAVTAPGSTTLTASASDNLGVASVAFYRAGQLLATDSTPGDGFRHSVSLTQADAGNVSFTAVARDAAGNSGSSAPAVVVVSLPLGLDRWVSPTGSDSNPGSSAQPYQSVGKALANTAAGGTVWLAAGTYTWANELGRNGASQLDFKTLRVPANVNLSAIAEGTVSIYFGLDHQGVSTVSGLRFSSTTNDGGDHPPTAVATPGTGTVALRKVTFGRVGTMIYTRGGDLTFDAGGSTTHAWLDAEFLGAFGRVDLGHVRILGGVMSPTRLPDTSNSNNRGFGSYGYSGRLTFEGVQLNIPSAPAGVGQLVFGPIQGGQFSFINSQATQLGTPPYSVLVQVDGSSSVRFSGSTVSGRFTHMVAVFAGGTVTIERSTLQGGVYAVGPTGGEEPAGAALPTVTITDSVIRQFVIGVSLTNGGTLNISGSEIRDNTAIGLHLPAVAYLPYRSAVYNLRLRNTVVTGNGSDAAGQGGVVMVGAETSVFDLGTAASPGGNTMRGATGKGPALRVGVPAAVTVSAVGNLWTPSLQGADTSGRYSGSLVVTGPTTTVSGSFDITSGSLRLAGSP